jgi:predicted nucleic acid-binding protein
VNMVLIDASAWIDYLRSGGGPLSDRLEKLLEENRAALCGIAVAEVRQGLRPNEERDVLDLFETLPYLETTRNDYDAAGALLAGLRRDNITIPVMDGLMAQLALRHEVALLENDKHFSSVEGLERIPWRGS